GGEAPGAGRGGAGGACGGNRRGTGAVVDLPAYENDVLNALTRTGGLPGLDAMNEVVIQRGSFRDRADAACAIQALRDNQPVPRGAGIEVIPIPVRLRPG